MGLSAVSRALLGGRCRRATRRAWLRSLADTPDERGSEGPAQHLADLARRLLMRAVQFPRTAAALPWLNPLPYQPSPLRDLTYRYSSPATTRPRRARRCLGINLTNRTRPSIGFS